MSNTITVTACSNELIFHAFKSGASYKLLHIKSLPPYSVDVTLNITDGAYSGCVELNGVTSSLSETDSVSIPSGNYLVHFTGINWAGAPQFTGSINSTSFDSGFLPHIAGIIYTMDELGTTTAITV